MKNLKAIIAFGLIILASACKKHNIVEPEIPKEVYVVGYENNSANKGVAKLWRNGVSTSLSDGTKETAASGVVIVGTDVYVSGYGDKTATNTNSIPLLWKNGVATELPTTGGIGGFTQAIATNGTDVYVVGYENGTTTKATIWKNGVASYLPLDVSYNLYSGRAMSVAVSGNDVYVVGFKTNSTGNTIAVWKNGVYSAITDGTKYAQGNSIAVSGNDVYVLGTLDYTNTVWKNGVATAFVESGKTNYLNTVFASNNNIYIGGYEASAGGVYNAKIFKNGAPTTVAENAVLNKLFVNGNDTYAVGYQIATPHDIATVWKNGTATKLSDGTKQANAMGVFVK